ncbi:hypothetical protein SISSUDRAFT_1067248 [Sistotremastrum suecicum HHB10207 ss-3]|uniref:Uncharacterized protein n=1 Tax=Sistotremastrum suecicum HHB10207 ss-3 TaxID=1314776 RepID=A0A165XBQ0_9AGAM|nr:hypothetical protein SISSUDRAFT_1067248 [Sistotremastrum suecicum HHB10207 ss-3]
MSSLTQRCYILVPPQVPSKHSWATDKTAELVKTGIMSGSSSSPPLALPVVSPSTDRPRIETSQSTFLSVEQLPQIRLENGRRGVQVLAQGVTRPRPGFIHDPRDEALNVPGTYEQHHTILKRLLALVLKVRLDMDKVTCASLQEGLKKHGMVLINWPYGTRRISLLPPMNLSHDEMRILIRGFLHANPSSRIQLVSLHHFPEGSQPEPASICYQSSYNEVLSDRLITEIESNGIGSRTTNLETISPQNCRCHLATCAPPDLASFVRGNELLYEYPLDFTPSSRLPNPVPTSSGFSNVGDASGGPSLDEILARKAGKQVASADDDNRSHTMMESDAGFDLGDSLYTPTRESVADVTPILSSSQVTTPASANNPSHEDCSMDVDSELRNHSGSENDAPRDYDFKLRVITAADYAQRTRNLMSQGILEPIFGAQVIEETFNGLIPRHPPFPPPNEEYWAKLFSEAKAAGMEADWVSGRIKAWIADILDRKTIDIEPYCIYLLYFDW